MVPSQLAHLVFATSLLDVAAPITVAAFDLGLRIFVALVLVIVVIEAVVLHRLAPAMSVHAALLRSAVMNVVTTLIGVAWLVRQATDWPVELPNWRQDVTGPPAPTQVGRFIQSLHFAVNSYYPIWDRYWEPWVIALGVCYILTLVIEIVVLRLMWREPRWRDVIRTAALANAASYAFLAVAAPLLTRVPA